MANRVPFPSHVMPSSPAFVASLLRPSHAFWSCFRLSRFSPSPFANARRNARLALIRGFSFQIFLVTGFPPSESEPGTHCQSQTVSESYWQFCHDRNISGKRSRFHRTCTGRKPTLHTTQLRGKLQNANFFSEVPKIPPSQKAVNPRTQFA